MRSRAGRNSSAAATVNATRNRLFRPTIGQRKVLPSTAHAGHIGQAEDAGQRPVDEGLVDDPVHVPEPVPDQHGGQGQGDGREQHREHHEREALQLPLPVADPSTSLSPNRNRAAPSASERAQTSTRDCWRCAAEEAWRSRNDCEVIPATGISTPKNTTSPVGSPCNRTVVEEHRRDREEDGQQRPGDPPPPGPGGRQPAVGEHQQGQDIGQAGEQVIAVVQLAGPATASPGGRCAPGR